MAPRRRRLANAGAYTLGNAAPRLLTFLLLPLYTRALSPAEYGRVSVALTVATGVCFLIAGGLDIALMRIYFGLAERPQEQRNFLRSLWPASGLVALVACGCLLLLVTPWLGDTGTVRRGEIALALAGAGLLVVGVTVPQSMLRAQERRRAYVTLSAVGAVATALTTVLLVVVAHRGVTGWLVAILLANVVTLGFAAYLVRWRPPKPFATGHVVAVYRLGLPLVPHSLAQWSLLLADRALLAALVTASAVGIYSLAATLAIPAMILVQSISQGFTTTYAAVGAGRATRTEMEKAIRLQVVLVMLACVPVAIVGPCIVTVIATPAYAAAAGLISWLVLGYAFLGLYYIPMNALSLGLGRTKRIWIFSAAAAALNLGLIAALVPGTGVIAAAVASAVGYFALMTSVFLYARAHRAPMWIDWRRLLLSVGIAASGVLGAELSTGYRGVTNLVIRLLWLAVTLVALALVEGLWGRLRQAAVRRPSQAVAGVPAQGKPS